MDNQQYSRIAEEFGARVTDWTKLDGYVRDAIIRDAMYKLREFSACWSSIGQFVQNYTECIESLPFSKPFGLIVLNAEIWTCWGTTLRMLEIG